METREIRWFLAVVLGIAIWAAWWLDRHGDDPADLRSEAGGAPTQGVSGPESRRLGPGRAGADVHPTMDEPRPEESRTTRLDGRVIDDAGSPRPGITVRVRARRRFAPGEPVTLPMPGDGAFSGEEVSLTTDVAGRFEALLSFPPPFQIITHDEAGSRRRFREIVGDDSSSDVVIVLPSPRHLQVRVIDERGRPVRDAEVRLANWPQDLRDTWVACDQDGRARLTIERDLSRPHVRARAPGRPDLAWPLFDEPGPAEDMLTLRLPRGIWRDVLVVAASDGRPLPGITVEAGPIWTPTFSFRARATTDAHGLARVGPFPPPSDAVPSDDGDEGRRTRSYRARLYFEAELFLGDDLDVTVDGSAGEPWRMALHRGVRILGRIVDEVGRPVEGPVSLKRSEGRSLLDDWAEDGRFVLLAPPWELLATDLVVSAIGSDGEGRRLEGRSMGLPVSPEDPFDIGDIVVTPVVPSSMRTFVACLRNEEGAPLPAAWLSIGDVVLTADANGCVTAKVTADETTTASAGCRGFADKEVEIACASLEPQVITLEASRRVTGRLVDASGRGVPHVTVCHHSSSYSSSFTRGVKTDADGAFIIPVAPRCDFQVWVYVGGIRRDSNDPQFTFPAGKDHHVLSLDHDLCTPVPVEFTLHGIPDAAMPYVHAIVRATDAEWDTGASVRADPGGIWRAAEPLEPGAWRLEISLAGRVISQTHFVVPNVAPKTLSLDVEVKVPPFLEVSSRGLPGGISITWEILDASGAVARIVESSSDECIALPARPGEVAIRGIADDYSCSGWVSRRSVPLPPLSGAVVTHLVVPFSPIPMLEIRGVGDQRLIEVRRASDGQPVEKQVLAEKDGIRFALAPDLYEVTIRRGDRIERHRVDLRSLPYVLIPDPRDRDAEDD